MMPMTTETPLLRVRLPHAEYPLHIRQHALRDAATIITDVLPDPPTAIMVLVDEQVRDHHLPGLKTALTGISTPVHQMNVVASESRKSLEMVRRAYDALLATDCDRGTLILALGGGIVGDLAGFVAATYLRGVACIQIPTTLLAMIDASVGGKTGVNIRLPDGDHLGKNLIGAFWQPRAVIIDPETLHTLPPREFRCGLAESIKHAIIADHDLFTRLEDLAPNLAPDTPRLDDLIRRSVEVKIHIVEADEREHGPRALLNLGHTFGHALEACPELHLLHGEAVAVGLVAAARLAADHAGLPGRTADRIARLVAACGLPDRLPVPAPADMLLDFMRYDKKRRAGTLRLVLPTDIGAAELRDDLPDDAIRAAWRHVGATD